MPPIPSKITSSGIVIQEHQFLKKKEPSPVSPNELGALCNAEFIGEKNFKLLEWLRRQSLTKEAAEKIAPQTRALQKGIDEKDAREQARIDTLRRIEQEIRDELESLRAASTERAVVIDEAGNVVIDKRGVQNSVKFTDEELALMAGKTLTHNHNINTTISYEDAEVFSKQNFRRFAPLPERQPTQFAEPQTRRNSLQYFVKVGKPHTKNFDRLT